MTPTLSDIRSARRMDDKFEVTFTFANVPHELDDITLTSLLYLILAREIRAFTQNAMTSSDEAAKALSRMKGTS